MKGLRIRFRPAKEEMFRLVRSLRNKDSIVSSSMDTNQETRHPRAHNVRAISLSSQHVHEVETQKAMLVSLTRHDKWKAGGPL